MYFPWWISNPQPQDSELNKNALNQPTYASMSTFSAQFKSSLSQISLSHDELLIWLANGYFSTWTRIFRGSVILNLITRCTGYISLGGTCLHTYLHTYLQLGAEGCWCNIRQNYQLHPTASKPWRPTTFPTTIISNHRLEHTTHITITSTT